MKGDDSCAECEACGLHGESQRSYVTVPFLCKMCASLPPFLPPSTGSLLSLYLRFRQISALSGVSPALSLRVPGKVPLLLAQQRQCLVELGRNIPFANRCRH